MSNATKIAYLNRKKNKLEAQIEKFRFYGDPPSVFESLQKKLDNYTNLINKYKEQEGIK